MTRPVAVLKLGGAQARGGRLRGWLDAISRHAGRLVVVPGGGPFADVVRATQAEIGFDDAAAHEMALAAMRQFGRALQSLAAGFELADSEASLRDALARGQTPIWSPAPMALAAKLPASWDITSDSLAAWLAGELGAERLILVKHGAPGSAADLAARGVVDPAFPAYLGAAGVRAFLAAPEAAARLSEGLDGSGYPEIRLAP
ncbi:MAG: aspartate kinase [Pseudomonadota bacterium]|nr:aspartate kinase [Pseudomonadota bacterium]